MLAKHYLFTVAAISALMTSRAVFAQTYNEGVPMTSPGVSTGAMDKAEFFASPTPQFDGAYGYASDAGMPMDGCGDCSSACMDGSACVSKWHRYLYWDYWKIHGVPCPFHSTGDMSQHIPYVAEPKNYYYLRPYQYFHVPSHQREAAIYNVDPRNPYNNQAVFDGLYDGLD